MIMYRLRFAGKLKLMQRSKWCMLEHKLNF